MTLTVDDVFDPATATVDLVANDRDEAITALIGLLADAGRVTDVDAMTAAVLAREAETGGTGMESGVAIPHAKSAAVVRPSVAFGRSRAGLDFQADDGTAADLIFLVAIPEGGDEDHVKVLSRLARRLIHASFRDALRAAPTAEEAVSIMRQEVQL